MKFFAVLLIVGYIGSFWLSLRAVVIEWMYVKESFINFINPFIHFKVLFHLLSDLDIYVTFICLWIGNSLMDAAQNKETKEKYISSASKNISNNSKKTIFLKKFLVSFKKNKFLLFFIIFLILCGLFFLSYIDYKSYIQTKKYEDTAKELKHQLLLKEYQYDELELQMKETKKIHLLKMLENEKDPIKYNALKEYYNQLSFEAQ